MKQYSLTAVVALVALGCQSKPVDHTTGLALSAPKTAGKLAARPPTESDKLVDSGVVAMNHGDYSTAEDAIKKGIARRPTPAHYRALAELYDKMGHNKQALEAWSKVMPDCMEFSDREVFLARYGDLCLQFGKEVEARKAFSTAVDHAYPYMGPVLQPRTRATDGMNALKAKAHCISGLAQEHFAPAKAVQEIKTAVKLQPNDPVIQFDYAHALTNNRLDARKELDRAEKMGDSALRLTIHRWRLSRGL